MKEVWMENSTEQIQVQLRKKINWVLLLGRRRKSSLTYYALIHFAKENMEEELRIKSHIDFPIIRRIVFLEDFAQENIALV